MPDRAINRRIGQLPDGGEIFLDHVGHFVPDVDAAAAALRQAGFAPAPVSVQVNPDPAGGPPKPTGTGNVCVMFSAGYVEVLFKTADTPLGAELDAARARYCGLHLAAFAIADGEAAHARLGAAGFQMQPVVRMQRPVGTATGEDIAAFEVVRLVPGQMPEGRIQVLRHKTEDTVWQTRWLAHPNGAALLQSLTIVVADVAEASARFERFTGRTAAPIEGAPNEGVEAAPGRRIALDRGTLELIDAATWARRWPHLAVPSLPFMGECRIGTTGFADLDARVASGDLKQLRRDPRHLSVAFPPALGIGVWTFVAVD